MSRISWSPPGVDDAPPGFLAESPLHFRLFFTFTLCPLRQPCLCRRHPAFSFVSCSHLSGADRDVAISRIHERTARLQYDALLIHKELVSAR